MIGLRENFAFVRKLLYLDCKVRKKSVFGGRLRVERRRRGRSYKLQAAEDLYWYECANITRGTFDGRDLFRWKRKQAESFKKKDQDPHEGSGS